MASTIDAKFRTIESWLLSKLKISMIHHPAVQYALNQLGIESHSKTSEMADEVNLSQRRFIQVFKNEVGMAPKLFGRVVRFQKVLEFLRHKRRVDWVELALERGYFDQAHFNHDFKEFSGLTPSEYMDRRTEIICEFNFERSIFYNITSWASCIFGVNDNKNLEARMKVKSIPDGFHTITPYLAVHKEKSTIEFLKKAFGAEEISIHAMPSGQIMNAEIKVGNSMIMLGEKLEGQETWPAMLYMYVEDADAVFKAAVKAGGKMVLEPVDHFYGDRSGAVEDPSGNQWWIATRKENVSEEDLMRRASQMKR